MIDTQTGESFSALLVELVGLYGPGSAEVLRELVEVYPEAEHRSAWELVLVRARRYPPTSNPLAHLRTLIARCVQELEAVSAIVGGGGGRPTERLYYGPAWGWMTPGEYADALYRCRLEQLGPDDPLTRRAAQRVVELTVAHACGHEVTYRLPLALAWETRQRLFDALDRPGARCGRCQTVPAGAGEVAAR